MECPSCTEYFDENNRIPRNLSCGTLINQAILTVKYAFKFLNKLQINLVAQLAEN